MYRLGIMAAAIMAFVACADAPCNEYVDYMCECHGDDPDFDCETLSRTYQTTDPELLDQCAIDLSAQKQEDQDNGLVCGELDGDTGG